MSSRNQAADRKPIACDICQKSFATAKTLKYHILLIHENAGRFECGYCDKTFDCEVRLKRHENTHTGERPFKCKDCNKGFNDKGNLRAHELNVHEERKFQCVQCKKRFGSEQALKRHLVTHTEEKPFECEKCPKKFSRKDHLKIHQLNCHTEKKFQCGKCDMAYGSEQSLKRHLVVHSEERPFECNECPQRFTSERGLKLHYTIYHKEKKFKCKKCGKGFATKGNLNIHVYQKHREDRKELDEQPGESNGSGGAKYSLRARSKPTNHRKCQDLDESDESDSSRSSDSSEESDQESGRKEAVQPAKLKKIKTENLANDEKVPDLDDPMEGSSGAIKREFEDAESCSGDETDREDEAVEEGGVEEQHGGRKRIKKEPDSDEEVPGLDDPIEESAKRIKREPDLDGQTKAVQDTEPDYYDFNELVAVNQRRMKKEENEMVTLGSDESDQESESPQESSITVTSANLKLVFDEEYRAPE